MTSLRGWYVTGHDIQAEYRVFQLTQAHARWDISYFRDAYNACLSITILPTELARVVSVDGPYIYKVFFQVIFAACPVLVYAIARRYWSRSVGILAAVYFVGFPTFFTDMPFLNRQEIAFLFVCVAILLITHGGWARQRRRPALLAAAIGIELSHYSTMYLFLGTLVVAWAAQRGGALGRRCWRRRADGAHVTTATWPTVGIGSILMLAVITVLWGELATHTAGSAVSDARSAVSALAGHSGSTRSGNVSYGLLAPSAESPQTAVNAYRQATVQQRGGAAPPGYAPASVLARYRTPVVDAAPALPLTSVGGALTAAGIPVDGLNILMRQAAAKGEQVFIGVGLIAMVMARRLRRQVGQEFFCLCVGATAMLAIITVLPDLSGDYGILRAFQGALILVAPVLVTGSLMAFSPLGRRWGPRAAAAVCVGIFVSTTGLLPQITGGYPAQLSLNNSGSYYNAYYMHPQEEAALGWLQDERGVLPDGMQAENYTGQFYFTSAPDVTRGQFIVDIYPSLVCQSSWVFLGYFTTRAGDAGVAANGDMITYAYPMGFLRDRKDLVYNNGGAEICR